MKAIQIPATRSFARNPSESTCKECNNEIAIGARLIYCEAFDQDFCSDKCFRSYCATRQQEVEWDRLAEIQSGGQV